MKALPALPHPGFLASLPISFQVFRGHPNCRWGNKSYRSCGECAPRHELVLFRSRLLSDITILKQSFAGSHVESVYMVVYILLSCDLLHSISIQPIEHCLRTHQWQIQFEQLYSRVPPHIHLVCKVHWQFIPPFCTLFDMVNREQNSIHSNLVYSILEVGSGVVSGSRDPDIFGEIISNRILSLLSSVLNVSDTHRNVEDALNVRTAQCFVH